MKAVIKGIILLALGILLANVGLDPVTGKLRYTFGVLGLQSGFDFVTLAMGVFGLGEILYNLDRSEAAEIVTTKIGRLWPTARDWAESRLAILRGSVMGFLIGVLPGGGAVLSSLASYSVERRLSKHPEEFGEGAVAGVAGPESANNAASSASFIPLMTLGIPANASIAMIYAALLIQGIQPGPFLIMEHPDVFWSVTAFMYIGNIMLLALNLPLVGLWVQADGHNLLFGYGSGEDLVTPQLRQVPVDPFKDFRPVARLSIHSVAVAVPGESQFQNLADIVAWAKKEKQPVTAAVSTAAGSVDLVMRGIGKSSGIDITTVPHAGGSQAVTTLIGGQTTIGGGHPTEIIQHIRSGRLRAVAVATPERDPSVPDIPTLKEQGVPFHTWGSVKGVAVPTKTPDNIVAYYENLFKEISEDPDFIHAMSELVQPVQYLNGKDYEAFMKQAYADYGKVIKDLEIKID